MFYCNPFVQKLINIFHMISFWWPCRTWWRYSTLKLYFDFISFIEPGLAMLRSTDLLFLFSNISFSISLSYWSTYLVLMLQIPLLFEIRPIFAKFQENSWFEVSASIKSWLSREMSFLYQVRISYMKVVFSPFWITEDNKPGLHSNLH